MAVMRRGFYTGFGAVGSGAGSAIRGFNEEALLWTSFPSGFATAALPFSAHIGERIYAPAGQAQKAFEVNSNHAMMGMDIASVNFGSGTRMAFYSGPTGAGLQVAEIRFDNTGLATIWIDNGGSLTQVAGASFAFAGSVNTYYTLEFGFAATNPASFETRRDGIRIASLSTTDFLVSGGHPAGTVTRPAFTATTMGGVQVNRGNTGSPHLYYYWHKFGSSMWTSVETAPGTSYSQLSDWVGVSKKYQCVPNATGNYLIAAGNWQNTAGTHPTNLADTTSGFDGDSSYIRNLADGLGASASANRISHNYSNMPAAATRAKWVQRNVWCRTEQAPSGIKARAGVRSAAGDSPASTDFFDDSIANTPTFGSGYTTGSGPWSVYGTSKWYPSTTDAGAAFGAWGSGFTRTASDIWTPTRVNELEGIIESIDIL